MINLFILIQKITYIPHILFHNYYSLFSLDQFKNSIFCIIMYGKKYLFI